VYARKLSLLHITNNKDKDKEVKHKKTSVQSNLAKGSIAILSLLVAANAFIRHVCWTGTFVVSGRQTMLNAMHSHIGVLQAGTCLPQKCPFLLEYVDPVEYKVP